MPYTFYTTPWECSNFKLQSATNDTECHHPRFDRRTNEQDATLFMLHPPWGTLATISYSITAASSPKPIHYLRLPKPASAEFPTCILHGCEIDSIFSACSFLHHPHLTATTFKSVDIRQASNLNEMIRRHYF